MFTRSAPERHHSGHDDRYSAAVKPQFAPAYERGRRARTAALMNPSPACWRNPARWENATRLNPIADAGHK